jgi:nicotinamidase-related amidase
MIRDAQCLLTPNECIVALLDYQPQTLLGVRSHDKQAIIENAATLAKAARLFELPVVLSTIAAELSGPLIPEIQTLFPDQEPIDRTSMNAWEHKEFRAAISVFGRQKIVIAGLWTGTCACFPTVGAMVEGYAVYLPTDACGDISIEAHERAVQRAVQAGVIPMSSLQVIFELQRDWARTETSSECMTILKEHSAFGPLSGGLSLPPGADSNTARASAK